MLKKTTIFHTDDTMNSLFIPRAMPYTTTADVERVFNKLFEAELVERVDERLTTDSHGQNFKIFYVHFLPGTTVEMETFKQKMEQDGMVQVMTGKGRWFWKVYLNKSTKAAEDKPVRTGPRIMTEEDEKLFLQWKESRAKVEETTFTNEELDELDAASGNNLLTEDEIDELEDNVYDADAFADKLASE